MTDTRRTIVEAVDRYPGIHFSGLVRQLDLAPGQVQYHLRRLRTDEAVVVEDMYGRTHYYTPKIDGWERRAYALLRRETAGDIVAYLLANGASDPATITGELGIARSTLWWHLNRLATEDMVTRRRNEAGDTQLVLAQPVETARVLRDADPSLSERLVGRFIRVIDRLLERE